MSEHGKQRHNLTQVNTIGAFQILLNIEKCMCTHVNMWVCGCVHVCMSACVHVCISKCVHNNA